MDETRTLTAPSPVTSGVTPTSYHLLAKGSLSTDVITASRAGAVFQVTLLSLQDESETRRKSPPFVEPSTAERRSFAPTISRPLIPETLNFRRKSLRGSASTSMEVADP